MAEPDGKVVFKYVGDTSGIDKANNEAEGKVKGWASKLGSIAKSIGSAIAGAFVAAAAAVGALGKKGIELASDLTEVQNVVDTVFGDGAETINNWADSAQKAFGLSELQAKQFTGTMGAMLKSMGLTDEQTLEMSKSLTGLAGDMASFYNLDHDTAWEKIRSGISGETEPLKQLGINMSVTNLEAYAMSEGITTAYDAMTEAEKATLRYNYLLSVTADAQGDFARTSDSWANQLRTASNNVDALAASFGETLLPVLTPVLQAFNDVAVPALSDAFKKMAENGTLEKLGKSLGDLASLLSDAVVDILPLFVELLSDALPPMVEIAQKLLPPILEIVDALVPLIGELLEALGPVISMLTGQLAVALGTVADGLSIIVGLIGLVIESFKNLAGEANQGKVNTYLNMITKPFSANGSTVKAFQAQMQELYGDGASGGSTGAHRAGARSAGSNVAASTGVPDSELTDPYSDPNSASWYADNIGSQWAWTSGSGWGLSGNARGTVSWRGGRTWVGEHGPELVDLPTGTRIYPADVSAAMASAPNINNARTENTSIGQLIVYPDSKEYMRILRIVESSERARQDGRASGGAR